MKAVFMCKSAKNIAEVYTSQTRARLEEFMEFIAPLTDPAELAVRADELRDVEIVFST